MQDHSTDVRKPYLQAEPLAASSAFPYKNKSETELAEQLAVAHQEFDAMKEYAERVTLELRRLQQLCKPEIYRQEMLQRARETDDITLPPWTMNVQLMNPLLLAYDDRIRSSEAAFLQKQRELAHLSDRTRQLIEENSQLYSQLNEAHDALRRFEEEGRKPGDWATAAALDERRELHELYRVAREQVELLGKQNILLRQRVSALAQAKEGGLEADQARGGGGGTAEEAAVAALEGTRERLHLTETELARTKGKLSELSEKVTSRDVELDEERREAERARAAVRTLRGKAERLEEDVQSLSETLQTSKTNHEAETLRLLQRAKAAEAQSGAHAARADDFETQLRSAIQARDLSRKDMETAAAEMRALEKKNSALAAQNEGERKAHEAQRREAEEARLEADRSSKEAAVLRRQVSASEERLRSELSGLDEKLRNDANVLKLKLETERGILHEKSEGLERELQRALESLEAEKRGRDRGEGNAHREREALRAEVQRQQRLALQAIEAERGLSRRVDELEGDLQRAVRAKEDSATDWANRIKQKENDLGDLQKRLSDLQVQLAATDADRRAASQQVASLAADRTRLSRELESERQRLETRLERERAEWLSTNERLSDRLKQVQQRARTQEEKAASLLRAQESLREQWVVEFQKERGSLSQQLTRKNADYKRLQKNLEKMSALLAANAIEVETSPFPPASPLLSPSPGGPGGPMNLQFSSLHSAVNQLHSSQPHSTIPVVYSTSAAFPDAEHVAKRQQQFTQMASPRCRPVPIMTENNTMAASLPNPSVTVAPPPLDSDFPGGPPDRLPPHATSAPALVHEGGHMGISDRLLSPPEQNGFTAVHSGGGDEDAEGIASVPPLAASGGNLPGVSQGAVPSHQASVSVSDANGFWDRFGGEEGAGRGEGIERAQGSVDTPSFNRTHDADAAAVENEDGGAALDASRGGTRRGLSGHAGGSTEALGLSGFQS